LDEPACLISWAFLGRLNKYVGERKCFTDVLTIRTARFALIALNQFLCFSAYTICSKFPESKLAQMFREPL